MRTNGQRTKASTRRKTTPKTARKTTATAPAPPSRVARARGVVSVPVTDDEIDAAKSYEERGLFCLRVLSSGLWDATEGRLRKRWNITPGSLYNYRRAAKIALAAVGDEQASERLEQTLAGLRCLEQRHEELAEKYRATGRVTLALHHDQEQRRTLVDFADVAGLTERRVTISLEHDPRIAGLWQAVHAALEDRDRQEDERARRLTALVESLNGGVLPEGFAAMLALPSVGDHVRDAVRRYEVEIGARKALQA